jgi:hypothetical protein
LRHTPPVSILREAGMARGTETLADLDLTSLTDEELEDLLTKVQTAFEKRVQSRMAEFRTGSSGNWPGREPNAVLIR